MAPLHTVEICASLTGHGTVLLPHTFAAQQIRLQLASFTPALPPESPAPLAWTEWVTSLWSSLLLGGGEDRILLNRLQEQQLWESVIAAHTAEDTALRQADAVRDLAALARTAFSLAAQHRVTAKLADTADSTEARAFAGWWQVVRDRCRQERFLPAALLEEALAAHLRSGALRIEGPLHLVGFLRTSPTQQHLLDTLREVAGVAVERHTAFISTEAGGRHSTLAQDVNQELRLAVGLLRQQARRFTGTGSPRLALILPHAGDHRAALERLFREMLAPELQSTLTDLSSTPWHFSQQPPLRSFPLLGDALKLLDWARAPIALESVTHLLHSPYLAGSPLQDLPPLPDLLPTRCMLRGTLALVDLVTARRPSKNTADHRGTERVAGLRRLHEATERVSRSTQRSAAEWADVVRHLLRAAGWPGSQVLSPLEFRCLQSWESLLDQLSTLQFDGSRMSFPDFASRLSLEAGRTTLPSAAPGVPVQVLSLEEAEGLTFDFAVHIGATNRVLPSPGRRSPLLGRGLQRALGIGEAATAAAETLTAIEGLASRSGTLLLTASCSAEDPQTELTAFAEGLSFQPVAAQDLLPAEVAPSPVKAEPLVDPELPEVLEGTLLRGGVDVLRRQAACGFHAFATYRLGADDAPRQGLGLSPQESGSILHKALQLVWQDLGSQSTLKAMPTATRRTLAARCVDEAFAQAGLSPSPSDPWSSAYLKVARQRFVGLLLRWLEAELARSPFTVLAQEQKQELTLGPVRFSLRPDRVDLTGDGGVVLVDYKTSSKLSKAQWLGERPEAPQLPAYALCQREQPLQGLAFAKVRPGSIGWIGLSEAPSTILPGNRRDSAADLELQTELWREELTALATAFAEGDTRVDPKTYPHTCRYCAHRLLCRLDPATLLLEEELQDENDEAPGLG